MSAIATIQQDFFPARPLMRSVQRESISRSGDAFASKYPNEKLTLTFKEAHGQLQDAKDTLELKIRKKRHLEAALSMISVPSKELTERVKAAGEAVVEAKQAVFLAQKKMRTLRCAMELCA